MIAKPEICLLDDWRRVLRRAWSIRFSLLAAAFTAAEVVVPLFGDVLPRGAFVLLAFAASIGATVTVTHGTRDKSATKKLIHSDISGQGMGTLIPDAILLSGSVIRGVIDAKYKSLHPSASSPNGPQRDDLYQMAAYLGRFQAPVGTETWGLLAYPFDPSKPDTPNPEQNSPWSLDDRTKIGFATLPHNPADAVAKLRSLVMQVVVPTAWPARA